MAAMTSCENTLLLLNSENLEHLKNSIVIGMGGKSSFYLYKILPYRPPSFQMLFQPVIIFFFQKWTVFVFSESWSPDQLMQKAEQGKCPLDGG